MQFKDARSRLQNTVSFWREIVYRFADGPAARV